MIRVLGQSQFQDWENHFFVDRRLLGTSVQWILSHQTNDGSFEDPDEYFFPLDLLRKVTTTRIILLYIVCRYNELTANCRLHPTILLARGV